MEPLTAEQWQERSEVFAFLGNSLLKPIRQTGQAGLDPAFWERFPGMGSAQVSAAAAALGAYVRDLPGNCETDPVTDVSVEYTHLFVGPPKPAAAPWETMHRGEGTDIGFGQATFEMRELLRDAGLEVRNENNQYEDHLGIELLLLSVYCSRAANGEDGFDAARVAGYAGEHPLAWAGKLQAAVHADSPGGYYDLLLRLTQAALETLA